MHKLIEDFATFIIPVGSRVTCNPAPTDTDQDYLVKSACELDQENIEETLHKDGYVFCGNEEYDSFGEDSTFTAWRKGDINYIVTNDEGFFLKFLEATAIAKKYNLLEKQERVDLFQWMLYDEFYPALDNYLDSIGINYPPSVDEVIMAIRKYNKQAF